MGWKTRKNRPLSASHHHSKSTGDILKALWTGRDSHEPEEEVEEEESYFRQGYLHVQADDGFWFIMWIVLRESEVELYNEPFEPEPVDVIALSNARLVIPPVIPSECQENIMYPLQIIKDDYPNVACFAAKSPEEQEEWANAFRCTLQACSLSLEEINLQSLPAKHSSETSVADHEILMRKMELLEELLGQRDNCCGDQPKDKKTMELCQKLADADNYYDRVIIGEQQDALRRATYLRQRKISTQLKADTIRKQLSKNSKRRSRPKSLHEESEDSEFYEGQLQELTNKLKAIHTVLGRTEKESEAASRKLGRKYETEITRLHSDTDLGGNAKPQPSGQRSWSLTKSQEDCRTAGTTLKETLDRRNIASAKNKGGGIKTSSTNPLLAPFQHRRRKTSEEEQHRSQPQLNHQSTSGSGNKSRISPLRLFGNFVNRQKSKKLANPDFQPMSTFFEKPRSKTDSDLDELKTSPDFSIWSSNQFRNPGLAKLEPEAGSSSSDGSNRSSIGSASDHVRTKIDPTALAEIEAFESMTQQFFDVSLN